MVILHTNHGPITIELDQARAPKSAANFLAYARSGHFDGTLFHRVIDGFMIQGGGFGADFRQKPTSAPIENEAGNGLKNERYAVAMARTSDPHSATAQFFINVANNAFLDHRSRDAAGWGYCVFGRVVAGKEVVDKIKGVPTAKRGGHENVPTEDVVIERVEVAAG
ncbi:MAG TPA: peptidylprolyl isomerase [Casimicrobiaceae bacterium]|nr:peptidylprolyl isomerase [Casimicrobiaceae bacterium]